MTVSYAQATGEEVTDSSNNLNKLANFGTTIVTNGSSQDIYLPTFNAIHADTQVIADGTKIALEILRKYGDIDVWSQESIYGSG